MSEFKSITRFFFFTVQIYFCICNASAQGWEWQQPPTGDYALMGVFMLDEDIVYAVGSSSIIIKTTNGGLNWRVISSGFPTGDPLYTVDFADANNGWVAGASGIISHTTDGGNSWVRKMGAGSTNVNALSFCDSSTGMAVGYDLILRTTDGGATWINKTPATHYYLEGVAVIDTSTAVAVDYQGTIIRTTDGGTTWVDKSTMPVPTMFLSVSFSDARHGAASGQYDGDGIIAATTDGGETWTMKYHDTLRYRYLESISCPDSLHWTAVGYGKHVIHTTNGGSNWLSDTLNIGYSMMTCVSFCDSLNGTIAGLGPKFILRTQNGGSASPRIRPCYPPDKAVNQPAVVALRWLGSSRLLKKA